MEVVGAAREAQEKANQPKASDKARRAGSGAAHGGVVRWEGATFSSVCFFLCLFSWYHHYSHLLDRPLFRSSLSNAQPGRLTVSVGPDAKNSAMREGGGGLVGKYKLFPHLWSGHCLISDLPYCWHHQLFDLMLRLHVHVKKRPIPCSSTVLAAPLPFATFGVIWHRVYLCFKPLMPVGGLFVLLTRYHFSKEKWWVWPPSVWPSSVNWSKVAKGKKISRFQSVDNCNLGGGGGTFIYISLRSLMSEGLSFHRSTLLIFAVVSLMQSKGQKLIGISGADLFEGHQTYLPAVLATLLR